MARLTKDYSSAKQYLAKVLPWPQPGDPPAWIGITFKSKGPDEKKFLWSTRGVTSVTDAIGTINWALGVADIKDIYVCMGSLNKATEVTSKRGFKYTKAERNQDYVTGLKSLYIDLDAKGGDNSYASVEEAVTALFEFLKAIRFPAPSVMVRTGGGVHVYWTLDRILTPGEWLPHAQALVNAASQCGLKFDQGCSVDYARILRIPKTLNHKFAPPKEVELVVIEEGDYSVTRIEQALAPYKVAVAPKSTKTSHIENPELFNLKLPAVENELGAGIELFQVPKPSLNQLAKACPFVRDAITTGGAEHHEPLWYNVCQLAMWTTDELAAAHVMSDQHPGYTEAATDSKYEQAVDVQAAKGLGWPQCKTIAGNSAKACKTCPHLNEGKSPLNFIAQPSKVNGANYQPSTFGMKAVMSGNIDLPDGYIRDQLGFVTQSIVDRDGISNVSRVCDYVLLDGWVTRGPPQILNFMTETEVDTPSWVTINTSMVGGQEMRGTLQSYGLMMRSNQVKPMGEFLVAWTQKLQSMKESVRSIDPFGWSMVGPSVEGFSYGGQLYTPNGVRSAPLTDRALATHYTPVGALQPWYDAVDMVLAQNRPALDAVLAAAFAAPLVRSTGQPGLLMSLYSLESGIGKTTAMRTAQAVWGDPIRAMQGLDDTQNSVLGKLGKLRSLPMFWDELKTEDDTRRFINLFFSVTGGREKARMKANTELRELGSWETLLVSASNESVIDFVVSRTKMTTAGIYRMFEFTVPPGQEGRIPVSDASRIIHGLGSNFGIAGQAYADFLGSSFQRIDQEVADEMLRVGDELSVMPDERFWSALVATIVMGATYANEIGLTTFNLPRLRAFMLDQFQAMRKLRDEQSVDMKLGINVANILVRFLRDMRARKTIVTDTMWMGRGKPKLGSVKVISDAGKLDSLVVHASVKDKRLRVSLTGLEEWLEQHDYARHIFIESLKAAFGAVRTNGTLGAGTPYSTGSEFVLDIDMTTKTARQYLQDLT